MNDRWGDVDALQRQHVPLTNRPGRADLATLLSALTSHNHRAGREARFECLRYAIALLFVSWALLMPVQADPPRVTRPANAAIPVPPAAWALPPAGYRYQPAVGCDEADRGARFRQPVRASYDVCADQMQLLAAALERARLSGRLLVVEIGGTWCSWCGTLQRQIATAELLGWTGEPLDFTTTFDHVKIGVSTTYKGEREDIPSGNAVVALLMRHAPPGARFRALPYLLVVDPTSTAKVFARNLGDLPTGANGGYDPAALRAVLVGAHDYLRKGGPPPTEPGWLQRRLQRLFRG